MKKYEYERNFEVENTNWWFLGVRKMAHTLLALSNKGKKSYGVVLDIGCGTGALLDELKPQCEKIWAGDISEEALDFCRKRGHTDLIKCDAAAVPFNDSHFDAVCAIGVIEHLDNDEKFLQEAARLLKSKGIFIMLTSSFPFLWSIHDIANEHKRRYYLLPLKKRIEAAGFKTIRFSHLNFFLFPAIAAILIVHRKIFGLHEDKPRRMMPNPHPVVNSLLTSVLFFEAFLMKFIRLPWGVSMIGAFQKK